MAALKPDKRDLAVAVDKIKEIFGLFHENYEE